MNPAVNPKEETISCPVCEGQSFSFLFKKRDEPFVRCNACSFYAVIEHVPDLNLLVKELKRILAPSEYLYYFNKKTFGELFKKQDLAMIKTRFAFKTKLKTCI
jgi:hypothetical protein